MSPIDWFLYGPRPRGFDPLGAVTTAVNAVTGAANTAVDGATSVAGDASSVVGDATSVVGDATALAGDAASLQSAYATFEKYYDLYEKYKSVLIMIGICLAVIIVMCFVQCAVNWCQTCCCCVKCGYKLIKWECHCLGKLCVGTQHCVVGLEHARESALQRKGYYDGMDSTHPYRTMCRGGQGVPDDPETAAGYNCFGPRDGKIRVVWRYIKKMVGIEATVIKTRAVRDWKSGHMYHWRNGTLHRWDVVKKKWVELDEKTSEEVKEWLQKRGRPEKRDIDNAEDFFSAWVGKLPRLPAAKEEEENISEKSGR